MDRSWITVGDKYFNLNNVCYIEVVPVNGDRPTESIHLVYATRTEVVAERTHPREFELILEWLNCISF